MSFLNPTTSESRFSENMVIYSLMLFFLYISFVFKENLTIPFEFLIIFAILFLLSSILSFKGSLIGFAFLIPFQFKGYPLVFGHLSITDIAIAILFVCWLIRKAITGDLKLPKESIILFLFITVLLISILVNLRQGVYLNYFIRFLSTLLIFFIYYDELKNSQVLLKFIKMIIIVIFLISLYNFYEFFILKSNINLITENGFNNAKRVVSIFNQPNKTACFLAIFFPLSLFYYYYEKKRFFLFGSIIILGGIILTFSRSGIVVMLTSLLILPTKKRFKIFLISMTVFIITVFLGESLTARKYSFKVRQTQFETAYLTLTDSPLVGSGLRSYKKLSAFEEIDGQIKQYSLHSLYLQLFVETGLLGFITFLIFLGIIFIKLKNMNPGSTERYNFFFISSFVALIFSQIFSSDLTTIFIWINFVICLRATLVINNKKEKDTLFYHHNG